MDDSIEYQPISEHEESNWRSEIEKTMLLDGTNSVRNHRRGLLRPLVLLAAVSIALIAYTSIVVSITCNMVRESRRHGTRFLKSPANDYISYEPYVMEQWEDPSAPRYFGEPSAQVDHHNIGVSKELMHELGREHEGIQLPDGTYFGSIMVFHHLHCLKNLQHALHPQYYNLDKLEGHENAMYWEHTDHCLHMLMDAVMCQGDPTILTMKWSDTGARPIGNLTSPHECVNWDRLMEWVVPNSVDVFEDGMLVHPKYGPLFSGGKPSEGFVESLTSSGAGKINGLPPQ